MPELAEQCSKLSGEVVPKSSLYGLFAGKRKTIPVHEVEILARALNVPVFELMYPLGAEIELPNGNVRPGGDAYLEAVVSDQMTSGQVLLNLYDIAGAIGNEVSLIREGRQVPKGGVGDEIDIVTMYVGALCRVVKTLEDRHVLIPLESLDPHARTFVENATYWTRLLDLDARNNESVVSARIREVLNVSPSA